MMEEIPVLRAVLRIRTSCIDIAETVPVRHTFIHEEGTGAREEIGVQTVQTHKCGWKMLATGQKEAIANKFMAYLHTTPSLAYILTIVYDLWNFREHIRSPS